MSIEFGVKSINEIGIMTRIKKIFLVWVMKRSDSFCPLQIHQWDRRMVENGAVRTYEGHNNTHTTLQLGVDPTETLLVSGTIKRLASIILLGILMNHIASG